MIGKYKVLLTHGHYYNVSTGPAYLKQEARERGFDIVMFGHTHRPYFDIDKSGEKRAYYLKSGQPLLSKAGRPQTVLYADEDR